MRRAGLLIAGFLLASGAGLALATPANAAVSSDSGHPWHSYCSHNGHYHGQGYDHWYHHGHYYHGHHHGGIHIGIGIGIGIGL